MNDTPKPKESAHGADRKTCRTRLRLITTECGRCPAGFTPAISPRQAAVREAARKHFCDRSESPIGTAIVSVRPDGTIDYQAIRIDPTVAEAVADGLDKLSQRLRSHTRTQAPPRTLRRLLPYWRPALLTAPTLAFMAATYLNEVAWIDSALTLAGHLTTALLLRLSGRLLHPRTD